MTAAPFTEADVRRAVQGAIAGGMTRFAVEIDRRSGVIRLVPMDAQAQSADEDGRWFKDEG